MNKYLAKIVVMIIEAIIMGLLIRHTSYEATTISLLILIYVELLIGGEKS